MDKNAVHAHLKWDTWSLWKQMVAFRMCSIVARQTTLLCPTSKHQITFQFMIKPAVDPVHAVRMMVEHYSSGCRQVVSVDKDGLDNTAN